MKLAPYLKRLLQSHHHVTIKINTINADTAQKDIKIGNIDGDMKVVVNFIIKTI